MASVKLFLLNKHRWGRRWGFGSFFLVTGLLCLVLPGGGLAAQEEPQVIELTMETMAELTMSTSFAIRQLNLEIERDQHNLKAERARLKSSVSLNLTTPSYRLTSEPRWNSTLDKFDNRTGKLSALGGGTIHPAAGDPLRVSHQRVPLHQQPNVPVHSGRG